MKNLIFAIVCLLQTSICLAQNSFTIKMSSVTEGLPEPYASSGNMDMVIYSKGDKYKNETSSMMFNSTTYFDGKILTVLSEFAGNKSAYATSKEELDATIDPNESKPTIEYTNEKKMIAGYECTKAIVTKIGRDKSETKSIVWFTDKITVNSELARKANRRFTADLGDLKGVPLSIESKGKMFGMDVRTVMTVTEITTGSIDDAVFVPNTEGYVVDNYKTYLEKMKAMQQGGGR